MRTLRLTIADLFEFEGAPPSAARSNPDTIRALPDLKFSGLHLMCLMNPGFKRVAPEHDVQMDLNDPFLTALLMHKNDGDKH